MASITKKVDNRIEPGKRYQYWASSENADDGTVIAAADVFMIENTLGRPAKNIIFKTSATCNITVRFNSQIKFEKQLAEGNYLVGITARGTLAPDLANAVIVTDSTMAAIPVDADAITELDGFIPVSDIQIVSWTLGTFEIIVS